MPSMHIDAHDGTVSLPNGLRIGPGLSQDSFRGSPAFAGARGQDYGTLPWIHYHLSAGQVDGKDLLVSLCFYDLMLVEVSMTVDLYPPGPKDWSGYSLAVEAQTKQFHDRLLAEMFGDRSRAIRMFPSGLPKLEATLDKPLYWKFPWGIVSSYHDSKGGGTYITVGYGNRNEEANKAYHSLWANQAR